MTMGLSRLSSAALAFVAAWLLAGCGVFNFVSPFTAEETISKSFTTTKAPRILVETFNGGVDVVTTEVDTVQAKVTKHAGGKTQEDAENDLENIEVAMEQEGNTIRIVTRVTDGAPIGNRGATVDLQVPAGSQVDVTTSNGKITADGPTGDVRAQSTNGSIHVKESKGKLELKTTNGPIVVKGGRGQLSLGTSNGNIEIDSDNCLIKAGTSNGAIHFKGKPGSGDNSLHTTNGKIGVRLPADAEFRITAHTTNGSVHNDFTLDRTDASDRTSLQGTVGENPKASLHLQTTNGTIEIRPER
jgi:DUF4097 and DUF4098 domain-containing protein YvlB